MDIRWFIASLWRISVFALYTFPRKYKTFRSSRSQAFYKNDVLKSLTRKQLCPSRSNRPQMFFKIGVLKNCVVFPGKHCVRGSFLIKRLRRRCFPVNIAIFFKRTCFYRTPPVAVSS